jgi:glycosyltransferase involved in cell wall biosynthesis
MNWSDRTKLVSIIIIDEHYRRPESDGGSRAIWDLQRSLLELGHESVLANDPKRLQRRRWDIAIMSRPLPSLRWFGQARDAADRIVFLGHDLHHLRLAADQGTVRREMDAARAIAVVERACWRLYDQSLYPSAQEVAYVNAAGGRAQWFPYFRIDSIVQPRSTSSEYLPPMLLFVGGAAHKPNLIGMHWFAKQVLPLLIEPRPQVVVIGFWPEPDRAALEQWGITFTGLLDDRELADYRARASALIAPLTYGAGLKCKVVEALASGTPLVTTRVGLQGIESAVDISFIADTPQEWVAALNSIHSSPQLVDARIRAAGAYIKEHHGRDSYLLALQKCIAGIMENNCVVNNSSEKFKTKMVCAINHIGG